MDEDREGAFCLCLNNEQGSKAASINCMMSEGRQKGRIWIKTEQKEEKWREGKVGNGDESLFSSFPFYFPPL